MCWNTQASYDWRLSYSNLEVRDRYFSKLKVHIETARRLSDKKVAIVAHSMGSQGRQISSLCGTNEYVTLIRGMQWYITSSSG